MLPGSSVVAPVQTGVRLCCCRRVSKDMCESPLKSLGVLQATLTSGEETTDTQPTGTQDNPYQKYSCTFLDRRIPPRLEPRVKTADVSCSRADEGAAAVGHQT